MMITTTLATWLHDLDPFLVRFSPTFGLRWYGLSYVAGFVVAYFIIRTLAVRGLTRIPPERALDALLWLVFGTIIGGRLGYILVYEPALITQFSSSPPWWGVLAINNGGMASHGGILGLILASWRISRGWRGTDGQVYGRCHLAHITDVVALAGTPGIFFGRLANFINGELLGRIATRFGEPAPWWAVKYPQEALTRWSELSADQRALLAEAVDMGDAAPTLEPGRPEWGAFVGRYELLLDKLREGSANAHAVLEPIINARHPSQIYQAVGEAVVVGIVVAIVWWRTRIVGPASAAFLITYGVMRILTEFVRLPDPQFGAGGRIAGLSRGQWLSVLMIVVGLGVSVWSARRRIDRTTQQPIKTSA